MREREKRGKIRRKIERERVRDIEIERWREREIEK